MTWFWKIDPMSHSLLQEIATDFWSFDALELARAGSTTLQIAMHLLFINIYVVNLLTAWLFARFQAFLGDFLWCTLIS